MFLKAWLFAACIFVQDLIEGLKRKISRFLLFYPLFEARSSPEIEMRIGCWRAASGHLNYQVRLPR